MDYQEFLRNKKILVKSFGFEPQEIVSNPEKANLFDWQKEIVYWTIRRGRAAIFASYGLGKTIMQLSWAKQITDYTKEPVLILAPLAVAQQTAKEKDKFGIDVNICRKQVDVKQGINVTNYEMLDHFKPEVFSAVVLDESAILKSYMGNTKRKLVESFSNTPYRLCCTANPAPNDHLELGNHSEFLGIMPSNEMISRWFINDSMAMGNYKLKEHGEKDFWEWISSWAVSLRMPSDLGYADDDFILPPLNWIEVRVPVDRTVERGNKIRRRPEMSATSIHKEMRLTAATRAQKVKEIIGNSEDDWTIWCNTNYEADELKLILPEAIEVRGSDSIEYKEWAAGWFCEKNQEQLCYQLLDSQQKDKHQNSQKKQNKTPVGVWKKKENITKTGITKTKVDVLNIRESMQTKEMRIGENDTSQMRNIGNKQKTKLEIGKKQIQKVDLDKDLDIMELPQKNIEEFLKNKTEFVEFVESPNILMSQKSPEIVEEDSMLITVTKQEKLEDFFVPNVTLELESLKKKQTCLIKQSNTYKKQQRKRKILISKPTIFGFGLNFQHCHNTIFVGLSYSFEQLHQSIHRHYRFGQKNPVNAYLILAETEHNILSIIKKKMQEYERMMLGLRNVLKEKRLTVEEDLRLIDYCPTIPLVLPEWLKTEV